MGLTYRDIDKRTVGWRGDDFANSGVAILITFCCSASVRMKIKWSGGYRELGT